MKNMTNRLHWQDKNSVSFLKTVLEANGLVVGSTDTIIGFLALLTQKSFDHLSAIKGRTAEKNYLVVSRNMSTALHFVQKESISEKVLGMLSHCWPGPVTVIFKANSALPLYLRSHEGKVAIRCPNHVGLQELLKHFDGLFSTSVNRSGKPAAQTVGAIAADLLADIACVVTDDNEVAKVLPSTIIDVSREYETGLINVIRDGAYPIAELERLYGAPFSY